MSDPVTRLKETLRDLTDAKTATAPRIVEAIRGIENALQTVLGNEVLHGLPNCGDGELKIRGLVVRSPRKDRVRYPDVGETTKTLLLRPNGSLAFVEIASDGDTDNGDELTIQIRAARDDEFLTSDVRAVVETVNEAVTRHLDKVDRTTQQWRATGDLAKRLLDALAS